MLSGLGEPLRHVDTRVLWLRLDVDTGSGNSNVGSDRERHLGIVLGHNGKVNGHLRCDQYFRSIEEHTLHTNEFVIHFCGSKLHETVLLHCNSQQVLNINTI